MPKRIDWIDYAKGLGILLVVYGHILQGLTSANLELSPKMFFISNSLVYGFHMPLFFVLSGMFAENWISKHKPLNAVKNKAFSLLLPYFIWSFVQGSFIVCLHNYVNYPITWNKVVESALFQPYLQFWFLYVLFIVHVLYLVLRRFLNPKLLIIALLALYIARPYINFWVSWKICTFSVYFCLGAIMKRDGIESILGRLNNKWGLPAVLLGFIGINILYVLYSVHFPLFDLIVGLVGITLTILLAYKLSQLSMLKWVKTLGLLSMPIYLLHVISGAGVRITLMHCLGITDIYVHAILGCALGIILPILFYKAIEKIRLNTLLFGR